MQVWPRGCAPNATPASPIPCRFGSAVAHQTPPCASCPLQGLVQHVPPAPAPTPAPAGPCRYGTAVEQAVVDIGVAIAAEHPQGDDGDGIGGAVVLGCFVAGFLGLAAYAARNSFKQQRQYDDCRAKLEALRRDQARLTAGGTYNPTSCPICLEDFDLPPGQQVRRREVRIGLLQQIRAGHALFGPQMCGRLAREFVQQACGSQVAHPG